MPRFFYLQCKNNQIFAIDKKIPEKIKKIKFGMNKRGQPYVGCPLVQVIYIVLF